jgi:hypothetical protein
MPADITSTMGNVSASHSRNVQNAAADHPGESPGTLSFGDFLDVINPLQHIPVISTIYRRITGDAIDPEARLAGGVLYGGPLGFVSALANVIVEEQTGKDIGETISTALLGEETDKEERHATTIRTADIAWQKPVSGTQTGVDGQYRAPSSLTDGGRIAWFGPRLTGRVELADLHNPATPVAEAAGAASGTGNAPNAGQVAAAYRKVDDYAYMDERFDR